MNTENESVMNPKQNKPNRCVSIIQPVDCVGIYFFFWFLFFSCCYGTEYNYLRQSKVGSQCVRLSSLKDIVQLIKTRFCLLSFCALCHHHHSRRYSALTLVLNPSSVSTLYHEKCMRSLVDGTMSMDFPLAQQFLQRFSRIFYAFQL